MSLFERPKQLDRQNSKIMKGSILLLLLTITISSFAQSNNYFRHLRYNHVSPFIEITGIHPIDESIANSTSHYVFKYDKSDQLSTIINNHYHTEKVHHLASLGVHTVVFNYDEGKEIRTFYDPNNKRIANDRNVYKEVYLLNDNNKRIQLNFYDLADEPMESNWGITEYQWKESNQYIIERRYNLQKELVNLSPYFEFGITGILLDENGVPKGHYNLDDQLNVIENSSGVASYQDKYDQAGNHVTYSYHNKNDDLTMNQWHFAVGEKKYDSIGNNIQLELSDTEQKIIRTREVYSNVSIKLSLPTSVEDSIEIKKQSLGYLIALQQLDPELMETVLNDSLNKITIGFDRAERKQFGKATTKEQMIEFAENWNQSGTKFPPNPLNKIKILDIYDHIATVKLTSDNWVEYLQLIKLNGRWEIMNLIWQYKDTKSYSH